MRNLLVILFVGLIASSAFAQTYEKTSERSFRRLKTIPEKVEAVDYNINKFADDIKEAEDMVAQEKVSLAEWQAKLDILYSEAKIAKTAGINWDIISDDHFGVNWQRIKSK